MNRSTVLVVLLLAFTLAIPPASAWCGPLCQYTQKGTVAASKNALIFSPYEASVPTWHIDTLIASLRSAGYRVTVVTNAQASIQFLRTQLKGFSLIILRTDSFPGEGLTYYCTGQTPTLPTDVSSYQKAYSGMIQKHEVQVSSCVGFSLIFLQDYYPSGLSGLLYIVGPDGQDLANPWLKAGGSVAVGYQIDMSITWGRLDVMTLSFFKYLTQGYTVVESYARMDAELHANHGVSADWPAMWYDGNQNYKI